MLKNYNGDTTVGDIKSRWP